MEEENKTFLQQLIKNIIVFFTMLIYFVCISLIFIKIGEPVTFKLIKISSLFILFLSIGIFEVAYHKDEDSLAITGIEVLALAIHTLTSFNVINKIGFTFDNYMLVSCFIIFIYYLLKSIIIYTNEKREYLKSLSDISEIVENTPIKKEATKKKGKKWINC